MTFEPTVKLTPPVSGARSGLNPRDQGTNLQDIAFDAIPDRNNEGTEG